MFTFICTLIQIYKADMLKRVEEAKYEMFRQLMDAFEQERKVLEKAHHNTQSLLAQAAKVCMCNVYDCGSFHSECTSSVETKSLRTLCGHHWSEN